MTGDILKSFLVGLGFEVDTTSLARFNKSVTEATLKVAALGVGIEATAAVVVKGISDISEGFEEIGYQYRILSPAINKAIVLKKELFKAYNAAGINIEKTVFSAYRLNLSLSKTKFALDAIYKSVGARFFGVLTKQSDIFRQKIYANLPKIQKVLESFVTFVFKALDAVNQLGLRLWSILGRVYDFFVALDKATDGWSTKILAAIAIWKLFNLGFLATPLGMLLALGTAVLALYDDFVVFREGGKSLIDWGSDFTQMLVGLSAGLAGLAVVVGAVYAGFQAWAALQGIITLVKSFNAALTITDALLVLAEAPFYAIAAAIGAIVTALTLADAKWKIFGGNLSGFFTGIGGKILDFIAPHANTNLSQVNTPTPLGAGGRNNSQQNVNANLQTNVNIQGVPDAASVGKIVTGEQKNNIFDLVRNMQGAVKPGGGQ